MLFPVHVRAARAGAEIARQSPRKLVAQDHQTPPVQADLGLERELEIMMDEEAAVAHRQLCYNHTPQPAMRYACLKCRVPFAIIFCLNYNVS